MRFIQLNGHLTAIITIFLCICCLEGKFSFEDDQPRRIYWTPVSKRNGSIAEQIHEPFEEEIEPLSGNQVKEDEVDMKTMISTLFELAEKNYTFHIHVGDAYITSLDDLLKHPGYEEAVREAYRQVRFLRGHHEPDDDDMKNYFPEEDFYPTIVDNHPKYSEKNTDRPSDSSRIVSRNSPHQADVNGRKVEKTEQKLTNNGSSLYYKEFNFILYLSIVLLMIQVKLHVY